VIATDLIGRTNYHTITTTTAPMSIKIYLICWIPWRRRINHWFCHVFDITVWSISFKQEEC